MFMVDLFYISSVLQLHFKLDALMKGIVARKRTKNSLLLHLFLDFDGVASRVTSEAALTRKAGVDIRRVISFNVRFSMHFVRIHHILHVIR
ncbi:hypothetical protein O6H91_Y551300 [Diphasiastrum complanatum]|nr:hypothetical protein O6H91_Y551300 [Diphasiastrum complanatum]